MFLLGGHHGEEVEGVQKGGSGRQGLQGALPCPLLEEPGRSSALVSSTSKTPQHLKHDPEWTTELSQCLHHPALLMGGYESAQRREGVHNHMPLAAHGRHGINVLCLISKDTERKRRQRAVSSGAAG